MDYSARIEKANDYDYPPVGGHYEQNESYPDLLDLTRSLRTENEQLQRENKQLKSHIAELERENIPSIASCNHGLPRGCCAICAEQRERERMIEWNMNVRADGAYQE